MVGFANDLEIRHVAPSRARAQTYQGDQIGKSFHNPINGVRSITVTHQMHIFEDMMQGTAHGCDRACQWHLLLEQHWPAQGRCGGEMGLLRRLLMKRAMMKRGSVETWKHK
jgi:hypothetical protein